MRVPRISSSSYLNTAPLVWSFLYGSRRGQAELILDTAPARSAELLRQNRVDAAFVPVIAYQTIENARLVPEVCVGARNKVQSVCLVTKGEDLQKIKTVALDASSKTSLALTKIIFRKFLGFAPGFKDYEPDLPEMLRENDCALLIGDPALTIDESRFRKFDLAELWHSFTGLGFIFAMWMTRRETSEIDFAAARDEGLKHLDEIIASYAAEIPLGRKDFKEYLTENIRFSTDENMLKGLSLYFHLAHRHGLIEMNRPLEFIETIPI